MFCEKCGTEIPKGAKFCEKCGALVEPDIQESKEDSRHKGWLFGGIIGGIVIVTVAVGAIFVTSIFRGKEETVKTSNGGEMQSDAGESDVTAQPTEQPIETPVSIEKEESTDIPAITPNPVSEPTESPAVSTDTTTPKVSTDDVNVKKEVKKIRALYNKTQNNLESYMTGSELEESTYYYEDGWAVKITIKGGYNDWKYSREYFYHNKKLYFAFVYKGSEEHRLYFKDGKLIRYIDEKKNTYDYGDNRLSSFSEWKDKVQSESAEIYPEIPNCGN